MTVNYSNPVKQARMTAVRDQIDGGSGAGILEIGTAAMGTVLATITLDDPSGTVAGAGVLTLSNFPRSDTSADASGTAAAARIRDSNGNVVISGMTAGLSGTDVILDSVSITSGQTVRINSVVFTHA
jgi:hypothetical protein